MPKNAVSLSSELHLLMQTLRATRLLAAQLAESFANDERISEAIGSTLAMAIERIQILDRVVRGTVEPWLLACSENRALPANPGDEEDILLTPWSDRKASRRYKAEWRRARTRLQRNRAERGQEEHCR